MNANKHTVARSGVGGLCHCTALRKASRRISQLYDTALAPSGLKTTQRAILSQIGRSEPTTVGALAEALVMDPGALAHTLKPLERDHFIAAAVDPADRRNRLITLTQRGRAKLAESEALWAKAQQGFEAGVGRADSDALRQALRLLISDDFAAAFANALSRSARRMPPDQRAQKRHV
jgi:DNA-binding MarR family transcriptional regulator